MLGRKGEKWTVVFLESQYLHFVSETGLYLDKGLYFQMSPASVKDNT